MKHILFSFAILLLIVSCRNGDSSNAANPNNPSHPVTQDQSYLTEEYVDSLIKNRQQLLIDFRREIGFECVNLMDGSYLHLKVKVYPDGSYDDLEVLDKEEVDMKPIRDCVYKYIEEMKPNFGKLRDLPSSGKTTNRHPHVYTLLIY